MTDWLQDVIKSDATVLTANHRLAAALTRDVNARHVQEGRRAWRPQEIREWRGYLAGQYRQASVEQDLPLPLSPRQSLLLWEDALRPDLDDGSENLPALARLARDTRDALVDHRVSADAVATLSATEDQRLFSQSLRRYLARLANNGWTDDAGVREFVVENADRFDWPRETWFAGFIEISPLIRTLQDALRSAGGECRVPAASRPANPELCAFHERAAELRAAGLWAREQREQGRRVAIVVSGLESSSAETGALVREGFTPGWQFGGQAASSVNVSFGRRLVDYPMVSVALLALRFLVSPAKSAELSILLRSGMLGDHADSSRASAAIALHEVPDRDWTPGLLDAWRSPIEGSSLERFVNSLRQLAEALPTGRQPAKAWAAIFESTLDALGWPGADTLDSDEFQLANRWRELLEEFSSLATVTGALTGSQALARLGLIAADTVYQPEQLDKAIDVLGPMEAAGQSFDALWVAGLTDAEWPGTARPSPLLSLKLQRDAGMRDSSPEQRLGHQSALLAQLVAAAPTVVLSYPETDGDSETSPSPLIGSYAPRVVSVPDPGWYIGTLADPSSLTRVDEVAPPVRIGERVYGGSRIADLQHSSPFDAFVSGRLAIDNPEPFSPAVSARIRGILAHGALDRLYEDLGSQAELSALDDGALKARIVDSIATESKAWFVGVDDTLRRLLQLEEQRLEGVLFDVVALDRERDTFTVVAREGEAALQHGNVRLGFRVDRIDRLADGSLLLLDYKTGNRAEGFVRQDGDPRSFQLVLYSMCFDEPVSGIGQYFASAKETVIKGVGQGLDKTAQFDALMTAWRGEVRGLLDNFAAGDLRIVAQRPLSDGMDSMLLSRLPELKRRA